MKLREHKDWPSSWACVAGAAPSAGEVRQEGILVAVGLSSNHGITLHVDYKGLNCNAAFLPKDFQGSLSDLRDRIALYKEKPIREVENIDLK